MTSKLTPPPLTPSARLLARPSWQETDQACDSLRTELRAAGITMIRPVVAEDARGRPYVHLHGIDATEAQNLSRLIRKAIRRRHRIADELHESLRQFRLDDFPKPEVRHRKIALGEVPVETADRLATILGAAPQSESDDITDWPEAHLVMSRLDTQVRRVTGSAVFMEYLPWCQRCDGQPAISLGDLTFKSARRLVRALQQP